MVPTDTGTLDCRSSYIGIGLMHGRDGEILTVATNGPADHAGLRVGDILTSPWSLYMDAQPVGTILRVEFQRDGVHQMRMVRVGKICYT